MIPAKRGTEMRIFAPEIAAPVPQGVVVYLDNGKGNMVLRE